LKLTPLSTCKYKCAKAISKASLAAKTKQA
jgi:hypothetical protein